MSYLNRQKSKKKEEDIDSETNFYNFKVTIVGDIAVGKTSILNRYIFNQFDSNYKATVGVEFQIKNIKLENNIRATLKIWDTCGEEQYFSITRQYYRGTQGALIVFDLTNPKSFNRINQWLADIKTENKNDVVIVLVGNKSDCEEKSEELSLKAKQYAANKKIIYKEVSAKLGGTGIKELFDELTVKLCETAQKSDSPDNETNPEFVKIDNTKSDAIDKKENGKTKKGCC